MADHHEPGDPAADQGHARRTRSHTARLFDLLLGDNLAGRKDYIAENGISWTWMPIFRATKDPNETELWQRKKNR